MGGWSLAVAFQPLEGVLTFAGHQENDGRKPMKRKEEAKRAWHDTQRGCPDVATERAWNFHAKSNAKTVKRTIGERVEQETERNQNTSFPKGNRSPSLKCVRPIKLMDRTFSLKDDWRRHPWKLQIPIMLAGTKQSEWDVCMGHLLQ